MTLNIQTGKNNPILKIKSKPINKIDEEILNLIKNMQETMIKDNGAGLSACQIGKNIRIFVVNPDYSKKCIFINPEIIKLSKKTEIIEEGCLSLPNLFVPVKRAKSIKVKALNEKGKEFKLKAKDMLARIIQHENDHLNGILICDND
jgi:peptide deformylase